MSRHKLILSVLSRAFFFIWVPSLPRSIQARLDNLDDAIVTADIDPPPDPKFDSDNAAQGIH